MIRVSAMFDNSGYGEASKHTTSLLINRGFDVSTNIIRTPMSRIEFSKSPILDAVLKRISTKNATINLAITVPFLCDYHFQKNSHCILYMFWETDRLSENWISSINNGLTTEVWVPCQSNYNALLNSGITKPIYLIPQYVKTNLMSPEKARAILPIPGDENTYKFYSIFQWSQRKNPEVLFNAYFNEFSKENVLLVVKTYGPSPFADRRKIKEAIVEMKEKSGSKAQVYLIDTLLQPEQVDAIAPQCNAYITTTRGEGLNIPLVNALTYKQQAITTLTGGIADWITDDSAYVIPHKLVKLDASTQAWGVFYQSDPPQKWGEVEVRDVRKAMRQAYNERNDFSHRIAKYDNILEKCSEEKILSLIKERLDAIQSR
jgi:hypothetical protein